MIKWLIKKIVGSRNQRAIKKMWSSLAQINTFVEEFDKFDDQQVVDKTRQWQEKLKNIKLDLLKDVTQNKDTKTEEINKKFDPQISKLEDNDEKKHQLINDKKNELLNIQEEARLAELNLQDHISKSQNNYLDNILPEAFALVKYASKKLCGTNCDVNGQKIKWDMVHFDVQLIGGIVLHNGTIAEMATGEGKTLVATLPAYLNALTSNGVHIITVNDYLAKRDSSWMGHLYKKLGLTVGCIQNNLDPQERRDQYNCDITYGTNSEFGFDYLRDNGMASSSEQQVQNGHNYAIIDEVDSVLIDEARTPLIISGPVSESVTTKQYDKYKPLVERLVKKQTLLCNSFVQDIKKNSSKDDSQDLETVGKLLFKLKLGHPKSRGFMRFMEDHELRKLVEKTELNFYKDAQKTELFELKEELYFTIDEKKHEADLSDRGRKFLDPNNPDSFILPDITGELSQIDGDDKLSDLQKSSKKDEVYNQLEMQGEKLHSISQLLKAYCLYVKDNEYVVKEDKVIIVDEHTGREMPGRRWSDGLHQAVEAKENVKIDEETQTLATITIQNYFRLYDKLSGMTGTAETEASEFHDIYALDVITIPTNKPVLRNDINDFVYKSRREKFNAVINHIKESYETKQPILVGTASVEASETLSRMLKREKLPHKVLNAKYHQQEAEIVSQAGQEGSITVSTNMAGRGTDIKLGQGISKIGGLLVIGTERHESRRIDRQLRGRCARQGDPGETVFYVSFEDDLMRNFGSTERITRLMERFGMKEGEEVSGSLLNKTIETAQKRVEQLHYRSRKYVLDFDDVMNQQRSVVYGLRNDVISTENPKIILEEIVDEILPIKISEYLESDEVPDHKGFLNWINSTFPIRLDESKLKVEINNVEAIFQYIRSEIFEAYKLTANIDPDQVIELERYIILTAIDTLWKEHLYNMDSLREGVNLRSYAQKDPLVEYKKEAYKMFEELMYNIKNEVLTNLFRSVANLKKIEESLISTPANYSRGENLPGINLQDSQNQNITTNQQNDEENEIEVRIPIKRSTPKVGRNEPCPCGSGKKYKQCHGKQ